MLADLLLLMLAAGSGVIGGYVIAWLAGWLDIPEDR
jgi:hypothetical protein